jgi:hypothetical protein
MEVDLGHNFHELVLVKRHSTLVDDSIYVTVLPDAYALCLRICF